MSVSVRWEDKAHTIQRYVYAGYWTWDEVYVALEEGLRQLDTIDHLADAIVDMSATNYVPSGAMLHLKRVFNIGGSHPNYSGLTVFLNAEGYVRAMHSIVAELYPESAHNIEFLFAHSDEEAFEVLAALRPDR